MPLSLPSQRRLNQVHPRLKSIVERMHIDLLPDINIQVVQGLRTIEEQDALYAQGRFVPGNIVTQAKGGESNHNYGLAVDVCPFTNSRPNWNAPIEEWVKIGRLAESYGLEWGGSWKKFVDKPHIAIPFSITQCKRCYQSGGLAKVWSEAEKKFVV